MCIRDSGTVEREKAAIGVFITLEPATREMETEAVSAGFYLSPGWGQKYPRIQIMTIEQLLKGAEIAMPPVSITFKKAERIKGEGAEQIGMGFETGIVDRHQSVL